VFTALQGDPDGELFHAWQVGVMVAGTFLMLSDPLEVATLRGAARGATSFDRLQYSFLLGLFWGCLMLLAMLDSGWPEARLVLLIWTGAAVIFAVTMASLQRRQSKDLPDTPRARYALAETADAAAWRRRWQIGQMIATAAVIGLAALWPAMWDRPAFPVFLLVLIAWSGPPVRYAEGLPRAALRRTMSFLGVFAFVAGYALG
ncbi:MAG: hypothetical protein N4A39_11075, partial [Roseicyclus sp.]|nr:hypothetical protein [Roseicyclus sp.]